jgi:transcription elongation factor Elf1
MRDTWIGSGIYSRDIVMEFDCNRCGHVEELDAQTDDTQNMAYAQCRNCKEYLEQYIYSEEPYTWEE